MPTIVRRPLREISALASFMLHAGPLGKIRTLVGKWEVLSFGRRCATFLLRRFFIPLSRELVEAMC